MADCSLYLISPPRIQTGVFAPMLEEALAAGGVKAFQLRLKDAPDDAIIAAAQETLAICRRHGVAFILNDRADLVAATGADGVHLGQEDMDVHKARDLVGKDCVIGVSCHASRDMAIDAAEAGADYIAFGAFYPTASKPVEKIEKWGVPTPEIVQWWSVHTTIPCVAIGGINASNCAPLVAAGADFIAAITAVWNHAQSAGCAVEEFTQSIAAAQTKTAP